MVTSELEADASQGNALLTQTEFGKAAHVLVAGLHADERSLEVEQQVLLDSFLIRSLAVFIVVPIGEAGVGNTCSKFGVHAPIRLTQPVEFYRRHNGEVGFGEVRSLYLLLKAVLVVSGKDGNGTNANQGAVW